MCELSIWVRLIVKAFYAYLVSSMDYQEKYKYITDKLSVLKTEMEDLKKSDRLTRNDVIHNDNIRQGSTKRKLLEQVWIFTTVVRLHCTGWDYSIPPVWCHTMYGHSSVAIIVWPYSFIPLSSTVHPCCFVFLIAYLILPACNMAICDRIWDKVWIIQKALDFQVFAFSIY